LAIELIDVGLGEDMGYGHLRLDPGLSPYLLGELADDEADALRSRWAEAMAKLTRYLYEQQFKDARLAAQLTLLELPNLLAMLDWLQDRWSPERVVGLATDVEQIVANLGRPQALARSTRIREKAAQKLGDWSHARFVSESSHIDRLLERGDLPAAHAAAQELLGKCLGAGEKAFHEAAYNTAHAHVLLGRVLKSGGAAEGALAPLEEAQRRFQELANEGNARAERMASATLTETGDCLLALGRLEEAAQAYEKTIDLDEKANRLRDVAVGKFQLGTVRLYQNRYWEALEIYVEARDAFKVLGEPLMVATAWHQIGMVHEDAGQSEPAEQAYRQALAIEVQENQLADQASTLDQLGLLYNKAQRFEESVVFHIQAAQIRTNLGDLAAEGRSRNNLALSLSALQRYDEARQEVQRAIECQRPYGHAAQPWTAWAILEDLATTTSRRTVSPLPKQLSASTTNMWSAETAELLMREAEDDSAWGPPIHVPAKPWAHRVRVRRLDLAAKFYVLSVLYRLGASATVSVGAEKDVDITVVRKPGEVVTVDVKVAPDSKSWPMAEFTVERGHFIVFVRFLKKGSVPQPIPESYVLSSRDLRTWAKEHDGLVRIRELVKNARDAREAWDRLLPAA